jgi:hypothetical protein
MAALGEGVLGLPLLSRARRNADIRSSTVPNITNAAPPTDAIVRETQVPCVQVVCDSRIAPSTTMTNAMTIPVRLALSAVFMPKERFRHSSDAVKNHGRPAI